MTDCRRCFCFCSGLACTVRFYVLGGSLHDHGRHSLLRQRHIFDLLYTHGWRKLGGRVSSSKLNCLDNSVVVPVNLSECN